MKIESGVIVYRCDTCGAGNCKLWREYNTFLGHQTLYCVDCAGKAQKKDVSDLDARGRRLLVGDDARYAASADMRSDQIGWLIPAVPTAEGDTFWGYTSVPPDRCEWWYALPNREPR